MKFLVRQPSLSSGNTGDAGLLLSLKSQLTSLGHSYDVPPVSGIDFANTSDYNGLIYFGNDCIAYYSVSLKIIKKFLKLNKPVFIINCSFSNDPKNKFLINIASDKNLFVFARDRFSKAMLEKHASFLNPVLLCADLFFSIRTDSLSKNAYLKTQIDIDALAWASKSEKPIIAINLHQDFRPDTNAKLKAEYMNLLKRLSSTHNFLFLNHDVRKKTEIDINYQLYSIYKECSFYAYLLSPLQELKILELCQFTITARMHLGIFSLVANIPPIIVGYNSLKALGTLEHWGLEELYYDPTNPNMSLAKCYSQIKSKYSSCIEKITLKKPRVVNLSLLQVKFICQKCTTILDIYHGKKLSLREKVINKIFIYCLKLKNKLINKYKMPIELYDSNLLRKSAKLKAYDNSLMSKEQLLSAITIDAHRVEKGLAMANPLPNFGDRSKVLERLFLNTKLYIERYPHDRTTPKIVIDCFTQYYNWHNQKGLHSSSQYPEEFLQLFADSYSLDQEKTLGGTFTTEKKLILSRCLLSDPVSFFSSRRSIRIFSKDEIDLNILDDCVRDAISATPTICNRMPAKIICITDEYIKKSLLSLQNGNKGFGNTIPVLYAITSNYQSLQDPLERRAPFTAGGMLSMSLILSLHSRGFATCCLNWDCSAENDIQARRLLQIENDTIVMLLAVGQYENTFQVAQSHKRSIDDVLSHV